MDQKTEAEGSGPADESHHPRDETHHPRDETHHPIEEAHHPDDELHHPDDETLLLLSSEVEKEDGPDMKLPRPYDLRLRRGSVLVLKITAVVLGYWTISISMVFANKYLVGNRETKNGMSLFVAWMQCIITVIFAVCLQLVRSTYSYLTTGSWVFSMGLHNWKLKEILMMTVTFVGMLTFNNLCLKNVGVAFFQVARSTTLIFVVIFSITLLKKSMSLAVFTCCVLVAGGFVLGIDQEKFAGTLSISGVMFGILTSFFAALNGIFTKKALDVINHDSVQLTFLCNINAAVVFLPLVTFTGQFHSVIDSDILKNSFFWVFLVCTGVLGFAIAWISALQIDLTSPVTHHISANSKAVLQTLIAVMYFQDRKPILWWCSVLMVVAGATSYALIRMREEKQKSVLPQTTVVQTKFIGYRDHLNNIQPNGDSKMNGSVAANTQEPVSVQVV